MGFDRKTCVQLKNYVYVLIDPEAKEIFYIGKGQGNRVFDHLNCALNTDEVNTKYDRIRKIQAQGKQVIHLIVRHGLTADVAFELESALIDLMTYCGHELTNKVLGHHAIDAGLMTTDEIISKYNAEPLRALHDPVIIININRTYHRGTGAEGIYQATKECWPINRQRVESIQYALSEYQGLIVEVFEIERWYPVATTDRRGKPRTRWGFEGKVANEQIRDRYVNKSIAHAKRKGAAYPIRYTL